MTLGRPSPGHSEVISIALWACVFWPTPLHSGYNSRFMMNVVRGAQDALEGVEVPSIDEHQEMLIQAALATSLTWSRGPIPANGHAWSRASNLASHLGDKEMQLQAEYGLWLFNLRSGRYAQALGHGKKMAELAMQQRDQAALLTARRLIGTSLHFLGNHAEALIEIESMLDSYARDGHHGSHFRFGLDQRVAGWAFLSRILVMMGSETKARRAGPGRH